MARRITCVIVMLVIIGMGFQYYSVNQKYPQVNVEEYKTGDTIDIGAYQLHLEGIYYWCEEELCSYYPSFEEYYNTLREEGVTWEESCICAEVSIEKMDDSNAVLDFTSLTCESGAWGNGLSGEPFHIINPDISVSGMELKKGEVAKVILPFSIVSNMFGDEKWEHIRTQEFCVVFNTYPTKIIYKSSKGELLATE